QTATSGTQDRRNHIEEGSVAHSPTLTRSGALFYLTTVLTTVLPLLMIFITVIVSRFNIRMAANMAHKKAKAPEIIGFQGLSHLVWVERFELSAS
ncbi:MAG: hypothetical protein IKD53_05585, partial [Clostridia bacterium]|nr:hypothetical protein [Clostridia bacterium]